MAQQTKSGSNRSNGSAPATKRSPSRSSSRPKSGSSAGKKTAPGSLASKLKTPAIASGAAVAGLVGGLALSRGGSRPKVLGKRLPSSLGAQATSQNLADAAKQIGSFGERIGELANEVRLVREGVAHSQRRSPVEVVLEGLTSRRKQA